MPRHYKLGTFEQPQIMLSINILEPVALEYEEITARAKQFAIIPS